MFHSQFRFLKFQKEDLARGALHPGFILGWDTGLGKTIAMFTWPLLKVGFYRPAEAAQLPPGVRRNRLIPKQAVLLVVPGDGHTQTDDESRKHFKTTATRLDSQATFRHLRTLDRHGKSVLPPGYYLTSFTQLTQNGVEKYPEFTSDLPRMMTALFLTDRDIAAWHAERHEHCKLQYERLNISPLTPWPVITATFRRLTTGRLTDDNVLYQRAYDVLAQVTPLHPVAGRSDWENLNDEQKNYCRAAVVGTRYKQYRENIGVTMSGFKCVFDPTLIDLAQDSFGAIVVDESTKLQGEETLISRGCRQIRTPHRLPMSATPIKTHFHQVFRLAHFACGGHDHATPRFPYGGQTSDREDFAREFQVGETNLSTKSRRRKLTPQISNIHLVWKLLAPIILRRRKADCGEEIVPKHRHVIRVPMGTIQAQVYDFHMRAKYLDCKGRTAPGPKLMALRTAAANPNSPLLCRPEGDNETDGKVFSPYSYIPKIASALTLIQHALQRREQVLVGAAFQSALDAMSARLSEAGVPHLILDGRTTPAARGRLAKQFKIGSPRSVLEGLTPTHSQFPVVLAGVESMAELHSFPYCNNVILTSYSWARDKFEQFINRAHRINSPWPVNLWSIICDGSADRVLECSINEKSDAAELVLDGHLLGENPGEVNLHELLALAAEDFSKNGKTIDEPSLEKDWPALRAALNQAFSQWRAFGPVKLLKNETPRIPSPPPVPLIGLPAGAELEAPWRRRVLRRGGQSRPGQLDI